MRQNGQIVILSGPGGVGKDTMLKKLIEKSPDFVGSVSFTSREIEGGEVDGADYYFKTELEFKNMIDNNELLEYTFFNRNYYGTSKEFLDKMLSENKVVIFEIDHEGFKNIREKLEVDILSIFIMPPSMKELRKRLENRGRDSQEVIDERMKITESEIKYKTEYDYIVINDELDRACNEIKEIIDKRY